MNIEFSEYPKIPEFDPPKKGLYQGYLRLSFIKAMDKIASDEMNEIIEKTLPLFLELNFSSHTKFSQLDKEIGSINAYAIPVKLKRKLLKYINLFNQWAEKYNVNADWFLDAIHERLGHLAIAENYYNQNFESFKLHHQLKLLLSDYQQIRNDEYELSIREKLISEFFATLSFKETKFDTRQKLDSIWQFFVDKDEKAILEVEDNWKSKKLAELQAEKAALIKGALSMSYNSGFTLEVLNTPFIFEFRSWSFNEERKSQFRKEITKAFEKELEIYIDSTETFAKENKYQRVKQPRETKLNQLDRINLFVLYQVKKMSPDRCLKEISKISGKTIEYETQVVSNTVEDLTQHLGFSKRDSKTKEKKR